MKQTYARLIKCPSTLLRFVLGTLLMKLSPGVMCLIPGFSSLSDETVKRDYVALVLDRKFNPNRNINKIQH